MPWIICTSGDDRGLTKEFSGETLTIGRAPDVALRIIDDRSSRYHCKVTLEGQTLIVEDLNSTNGVKFKGKRYQGKKIKLMEGESFAIGSDVFTFAKSRDVLGESAQEIIDEFNKRRTPETNVAERTYTDALSAEMKRRKKSRFSFLNRLFDEDTDVD